MKYLTRYTVVLIGALLAAITIAAWWIFGTVEIRGRVLDAATDRPIPGAFVAILSAGPFDVDTYSDYATTRNDGSFVGKAKTNDVSVYAWKPGFSVNGTGPLLNVSEYARARVELRIRSKPPTNLVERVTTDDESQLLGAGLGFSFGKNCTVEQDSPDADFVLTFSDTEQACLIEARGDGGLALCPPPVNGFYEFEFDNALVAPVDGYERSIRLPDDFNGYLLRFVRTRDGAHYAKAQLKQGMVSTHWARRCPYAMTYAYQPTGSRELATRPNEHIMFPVEGFGIDRNGMKLTNSK